MTQVSCTNSATGRRRNIPVIVRISDVNDKAPVFLNSSYSVTIPEVSNQFLGFPILLNFICKGLVDGIDSMVKGGLTVVTGNGGQCFLPYPALVRWSFETASSSSSPTMRNSAERELAAIVSNSYYNY